MSGSGLGLKKLKLNNMSNMCNGTSSHHNGTHNQMRNPVIVQPEMAFYCFDVLYAQLHQLDNPRSPNFSNES